MSPIQFSPRAALVPPENRPSAYLEQAPRPLAVVYEARLKLARREPKRLLWLHGLAKRLGVA